MRRALAFLLLWVTWPACAQAFTGAMSGSWWDARRSGEGQFVTFETVNGRNTAYLAYFTYTADGRATWHVGNADYASGATSITIPLVEGSGARFGSAFASADVRTNPAGTATLEFVSCKRMRMRHSAIANLELDLTRLVGPMAGAGCGEMPPAAASLTGVVSGSWWNAARSGEGQFVTFETVGSRTVASVAYFTYTPEGRATWLVGNADIATGARTATIPVVTGSNARFGTAFRTEDVRVTPAGTITLTFNHCGSLTLAYAGAQSFTHSLTRLVGPLNGLACIDNPSPANPRADQWQLTHLASPATDFVYPLSIYVPPGYVDGSGPHPVIYAADAEMQFAHIVDAVRNANYDAIVVAVGNGGSARRFVDYAFPGALAYHDFLTLQLMPYIETQYRVDRTRRTFVGYSLSGSFAGISMWLDDVAARRWSGIVSIDGSFWHQTPEVYAREQAMFTASSSLPVALYFASAANGPSITEYRQRLEARGYQGLRMLQHYYQLNHQTVLVPGITDGLAFVFRAN